MLRCSPAGNEFGAIDTILNEEPELAEAEQLFGARQFLFATDYPHDGPGGRMTFTDVELFSAHRGIAQADKELIWHKNAARLLGQAPENRQAA